MKATELRIGNWWTNGIDNYIIDISTLGDISIAEQDGNDNLWEPIPLTERWLLKFGFTKREGNNICWDLGDCMIGWYGNSYATWVIGLKQENNELYFHSQIRYVHQLQNLYFALTGEELIIKLTPL